MRPSAGPFVELTRMNCDRWSARVSETNAVTQIGNCSSRASRIASRPLLAIDDEPGLVRIVAGDDRNDQRAERANGNCSSAVLSGSKWTRSSNAMTIALGSMGAGIGVEVAADGRDAGQIFGPLVAVQAGFSSADAGNGGDITDALSVDGEAVDAPVRPLLDLQRPEAECSGRYRGLDRGSLSPLHYWSSPSWFRSLCLKTYRLAESASLVALGAAEHCVISMPMLLHSSQGQSRQADLGVAAASSRLSWLSFQTLL